MPLTLAHPVAVLPLKRCGLPLSALVVGSISPDLEYLLHLAPMGGIGHTLAGLLVFCLPASLAALWIVHRIWEQPMRAMFAAAGQGSARPCSKPFAFWPMNRLGLVCLAILIGAITHLLWDSFTHKYGWMVQQFPVLSRPILRTHWGDAPIYKILQHGSTLLGLSILGMMASRRCMGARRIPLAALAMTALVCCMSLAGGIAAGFLKTGGAMDFGSLPGILGVGIVTSFVLAFVQITLFSIVWPIMRKKSKSENTGSA